MLREHYFQNSFLIKKIYKHVNKFDGIDELYFILASGEVIAIKAEYEDFSNFQKISDMGVKLMVFGGLCPKDNGIMVGIELKFEGKWKFVCSECENNFYISDNQLDELVYDSLELLEKTNMS